MSPTAFRWCLEYGFVFGALIVLKSLLFPLMLWWWFAPSDMTTAFHEATLLIIAVIGVIILLSIGSISRFRYRLTASEVVMTYILINLPFLLLSFFPQTIMWSDMWWGVLGDGLQLWWPDIAHTKSYVLFLLCLALVLIGRRIYVADYDEHISPKKIRMRQ